MNNFNISTTKNFLPKLEKSDIKLILTKFNTLNTEFLLCILDNIIVQNEKYLLFIIQRGLETLKHCFKMILLYTKNLDLTLYHCKKAYCYYVEFIGQIGDDNNSYLQLNSKDATLFVYKKTIFEIDSDFKKTFVLEEEDKLIMDTITNVIDINLEIILTMINYEKKFNDKKESLVHFIIEKLTKLNEKLYNYNFPIEMNNENLEKTNFMIRSLRDFNIDNIKFISICEIFNKKNQKKEITKEIIEQKLYRNDCNLYITKLTPLKFINWIFN
jgi:hypothetical protein